jgi:erythromycin esterase
MKLSTAVGFLSVGMFLLAMVACATDQAGDSPRRLTSWLRANAAPITTTDPNFGKVDDLKKFGDAVGNVRIVLLGEQTHGEGNVFSLKVRLVKYLHEHLGFDVLVIESGMFDGAQIWHDALAGALTGSEAQGSIFFMYARADQVKPLFLYIDRQKATASPLILASMDTPHAGLKSEQLLLNNLTEYLNQNDFHSITASSDWAGFIEVANKVIALQNPRGAHTAEFLRTVTALETGLKALPDKDTPVLNSSGFWLQTVKSIAAQFQDLTAWRSRARDDQMADNLEWLVNKAYPGKKLIVWAHNGHCLDVFPSMGADLRAVHGNDLYTVVFTGSTGSFLELSFQPETIRTPPTRSWESAWHQTGQALSFLDVRKTRTDTDGSQFLKGRLSIRLTGYQDGDFSGHKVGGLGRVVDGIFYLDQIQPVTID